MDDSERWQVRRWIESAMRAIEAKNYDNAWTFCNQAQIHMSQAERAARSSGKGGGT